MITGTDLHQFDVYNNGYFAHLSLTYVDGVIFEIAVPRMPYEQLVEFLEEKCGCYFQGLYYQVPSQELERGLVRALPKRGIAMTFLVDWAEMEVETEGVKARTSTTDGVEARNSNTQGVEARTIDSETEYESDDDSDYQSDKSVDYLSLGEDKLIELRNRMKANRMAKAKAKDKPDNEMNEPNKENSMPANNVSGETFKEHDIYMNELLKSLKTADKGGITEDHFSSVEKHVERYPMYDETIHLRLRKPRVDEKYTRVAQFKECLTYYALENDFSLWYERSGEVRVVAKCEKRPHRVSAPEKGKQRKQTKHPCASGDDLPKCPWRCYARWMTDEKTFQCISLNDEHTCVRNFNFGALINYKWIAKIFGDKIRANPDIRLCNIADLVMKRFLHVIPTGRNLYEVRSCCEGFMWKLR
nr:multidrug resistance-associated protein 5 [Tanacetum cinerariifolium]